MSANGTREITWSETRTDMFCLAKVGLVLDLEEKCGAGLGTILGCLEAGTWKLVYIRETIRLGLIGGGKTAEEALDVVRRNIDGPPLAPLAPLVLTALAVLYAVVVGVPGDNEVGKEGVGGLAETSTTQMEGSAAL